MGLDKNALIMTALVNHRDEACKLKKSELLKSKRAKTARKHAKSKEHLAESQAWEVRENRYVGEIAWRAECGFA